MDIVTTISTFEIEAVIEAGYIECVFDPYIGWDRWIHLYLTVPTPPIISMEIAKIEETPVGLVVPEIVVPTPPTVSVGLSVLTFTDLGVVTISIGTPCVVTLAGHGLVEPAWIRFTTSGALPTPLGVMTSYYVHNDAVDTFNIAATVVGAHINTSGSQSGVHHLWKADV